MHKYHIFIKADSEDELKEELREAAFILSGLFEAVDKWDKEYGGFDNKAKKKLWMEKARIWVEKNKIIIP